MFERHTLGELCFYNRPGLHGVYWVDQYGVICPSLVTSNGVPEIVADVVASAIARGADWRAEPEVPASRNAIAFHLMLPAKVEECRRRRSERPA